MSIYNFTDREHETLPNNVQFNHSNSNGHRINGVQPTAGYHQIESDFMSRSFTASNPPESPHQLTRPTSKTALLVRQRRAMLEQISCFICKGYLIDATTINECMDSFCKSCIVTHLRSHNNCPRCGITIPHLDPLETIKSDKVLQDIIYKLVPGLYDAEMKQRRDFYRDYYDAPSMRDDDDDDDSCSSSIIVQGNSLTGEQFGIVPLPKPFYKPTDSIDLSIEPQTKSEKTTIYYDNRSQSIVTRFTGSLQQGDFSNDSGSSFSSLDGQLFKTYLRCPAKLTVMQLKKFIAAKYNIFRDDTIHLLYLNASLKDEYSLIDVAYIYDWRALEHMQLFYIVERDLTKVSTKDLYPDNETRFGKLSRQSVGISTQTVKRVCIDPQPKFYDERNNNNVVINNIGGRSMRSRTEMQPAPAIKAPQIMRKNPITHTSSGNHSQDGRNYSIQVNGSRSSPSKLNQIVTRQAVSSASEQNGLYPDRSVAGNQFRSLRNHSETTKTNESYHGHNQVPKLTLNLSKPNSNHIIRAEKSVPGQNRDKTVAVSSQNNSRSQNSPFMNNKSSATIASTTQSSIMTLASFSGSTQSKIITSISACSTSVQTLVNPQRGTVQKSEAPNRQAQQSSTNPENRESSGPQLTIKFVTQGGTTLVFPRNNNVSASRSNHTNAISNQDSTSASNHSAPARTSNSNEPVYRTQSGSNNTCTSSANLNLISSETTQSTSNSSSDDTFTQRHNLKVKPVYKTFVDPTKLKSPNLKKFGFTARH